MKRVARISTTHFTTTHFTKSFVFVAFFTILSFGLAAESLEFRSGDRIQVGGDFSDNLFASGGQVEAQVRSTDDVFLAGGRVTFSGETTETLWAASGDLSLENAKTRNSVLAGGQILLTASQVRELIVAGGSVRLRNTAIEDDLVAAGGEVTIDSTTTAAGSAILAGGRVTIAGQIQGDVHVYSGDLKIEPTAVIKGNLTHMTESIQIADGAAIHGQTIALVKPERGGFEGMGALAAFAFLVGLLLVAPILAVLFPDLIQRGRDRIRNSFWERLGKGTVIAILVPLLWILLLVTVIGIPIALAALPFLVAAYLLAWVVVVFTVGDWLRSLLNKNQTPGQVSRSQIFGWTFLGSIVVLVILWIPFLGVILALVAFLAALGAMT